MKVNDYKAYKPSLREEFAHMCAYCEVREPELGGAEAFHVDHYKPKSKFPHLICNYHNLIYACRYCNRNKRDYWPSLTERILGRVILNPREDKHDDHVDRSNFAWSGKSAKGKWTVLRLRLDSSVLVERRRKRLAIENVIKKLETMLSQLQHGLAVALEKAENSEVQKLHLDIAEHIDQITALRRTISGPLD